MSQFIHEAGITLITKYFIRRYNCRPFINPHDHHHFVVSLLNWTPSILKGPEICPQFTLGMGLSFLSVEPQPAQLSGASRMCVP